MALKVFISSPAGLDFERNIIRDEINSLSEFEARSGNPSLEIIRWPDDIGAGVGDYGQSVINRQTSNHDILVCVLATRMGTPTPRANSGTEEEFDRALEAILRGDRTEVILLFGNEPIRPLAIDPHQLFLVRAFREKASRLGVLYHTFGDHDELRQLFRTSLRAAYERLTRPGYGVTRLEPRISTPAVRKKVIDIGDLTMQNSETSPQRAWAHIIPLSSHRRQRISILGTIETASPYFRFGFKYYDSREPLFSAGSIQTVGQNILFHIGRNAIELPWFVTAYRASYRIGSDKVLEGTGGKAEGRFGFLIDASDTITFMLDNRKLVETYFQMDGLANVALLGWSDEHEFECSLRNLRLEVS